MLRATCPGWRFKNTNVMAGFVDLAHSDSLTTDPNTKNTPRLLTPSRRSTFVIEFHVSPTHRCATRARSGALQSVRLSAFQTIKAEIERSAVIDSQMIGKNLPGCGGRLVVVLVVLVMVDVDVGGVWWWWWLSRVRIWQVSGANE